MTAYKLLLRANHCLIKAGGAQTLPPAQRERIIKTLLSARSAPEQARWAGTASPM